MSDNYSYVARRWCGCIVAAVVDDPDNDKAIRRVVAREVADWIAGGYTVERVPHDVVRREFNSSCKHGDKPSDEPHTLPMFEGVQP